MSTQTGEETAAARSEVVAVARRLERWCWDRGWSGPDPYEALNATRIPGVLKRSPLSMRVMMQAVKRSPVDLRPLLGIRPELNAATVGLALSAYARNGFIDSDEAHAKVRWCIERLQELRSPSYPEPCWGYHFDVQTRAFFYSRTTPNTIATVFAGSGLLDAHELTQEPGALELAVGTGEFFLRRIAQTPAVQGAYFGYSPGDTTPIHNASMLVCALLMRLASHTQRDDFRAAADRGLAYTVSRQRPDGSWPYGERAGLGWVDGFHTGYVLDSLLSCIEHDGEGDALEDAWQRGVRFYAEQLIDDDGAPRYTPQSLYPIDGQCAAQAIETLSRAVAREPALAERRSAVFAYTLGHLARDDGAFVLQRRRFWTNPTPAPRWVQAPILRALSLWAAHFDEG
jgi:hypothetical protein